jgi:hypothetical protein
MITNERIEKDRGDLKSAPDAENPTSAEHATNVPDTSHYTIPDTDQVREPEGALANIEAAALLISTAKSLDEAFALKSLIKEGEIRARKKGLVDVEQKTVEYG